MFFIYSLSLEDFTVNLYDFCRTKDGVNDLLDTVARNFIRHEEGDRRAESPYRDISDDELTEEGYFLRHSDERPDQIDVYNRKSQVVVGRVWNSYDVNCEKVMYFAVTEASLGLPIECTGKGVIAQTFSTAKESQQQGDHLAALKERLVEQRARVDKQIKEEDPQEDTVVVPQESDTDEEELENPIVRLKRRIAAVDSVQSPGPKEEILFKVCQDADAKEHPESCQTDEPNVFEKVDPVEQLITFTNDSWSSKIDDAKNLIDNLSGNQNSLVQASIPLPPSPPFSTPQSVDDDCSSYPLLSTPQSVDDDCSSYPAPFSPLQQSPVSARWGCPHENYESDHSDSDDSVSDSYSNSFSDSDCENAQESISD